MRKIILIALIIGICTPFVLSFNNSDVVGNWICKTETAQPLEFKLNFFEKDGRLYGKYITANQEMILHYIRILNGKLRFQTETKGLKIRYSSVVEGNKISGTISAKDLEVKFTGEKEIKESPQKK